MHIHIHTPIHAYIFIYLEHIILKQDKSFGSHVCKDAVHASKDEI